METILLLYFINVHNSKENSKAEAWLAEEESLVMAGIIQKKIASCYTA